MELNSEKKALTKVIIQLDKACRKWTGVRAQVTVRELVQLHSKPQDIIIYTNGSVNRNKNKSSWDFIAYRNGVKLVEKSSAYTTVTSSMRMEIIG